jgi:hypothetical protein
LAGRSLLVVLVLEVLLELVLEELVLLQAVETLFDAPSSSLAPSYPA